MKRTACCVWLQDPIPTCGIYICKLRLSTKYFDQIMASNLEAGRASSWVLDVTFVPVKAPRYLIKPLGVPI